MSISSQCMRVFWERKPIEKRISIRESSSNHCRFFLSSFFPFSFWFNSVSVLSFDCFFGQTEVLFGSECTFSSLPFRLLWELLSRCLFAFEIWRLEIQRNRDGPFNFHLVFRSIHVKVQTIGLRFNFKRHFKLLQFREFPVGGKLSQYRDSELARKYLATSNTPEPPVRLRKTPARSN